MESEQHKGKTKKNNMATRSYVWRTAPTEVEGTATVYVDSDWGSDVFGNGTRQKPYQSLTKAWVQASTKPSKIICKGLFSEQIANGNHSATIQGDYYGAAVFDGAGTYVIYGFTHYNMIFRNVPPGRGDEIVWSGSGLLAGVGRASANRVGSVDSVYGVAGSSVSMHKSALYFGYIGGNTAVGKVIYDSPVHNSTYYLALGGYYNQTFLTDGVVFNVDIQDRVKCPHGNMVVNTIFAKFAMIGNEKRKITFTRCLFTSDTKWYWLSTDQASSGTVTEITLTGSTSAEKQASLLSQLSSMGLAANLTPVFTDCIFSAQTYAQIFNDADNGDFTLVPGCDADYGNGNHCGALPPSLHLPILKDSTGVAGSWDERSVSGCLAIMSVDDETDNHAFIAIDTDSVSEQGEIVSKIISIDPSKVQLASVWSELSSHMGSHGVRMWKENVLGTQYSAGTTLPQGIYVVQGEGSVNYGEHVVSPGRTIYVTEDNTTFSLTDAQFVSVLTEVVDPSIADVLYCRCRSVVYARVGVSDDLQRGATYYNDGAQSITYHNRAIAPGESFFCMISGERFTCQDSTYKIAVMFDDTRVPASEWIPAAAMQSYFVGKMSGAILVDAYGIPLSSGNPRAYEQAVAKSYMDRRYVQFCVKVKKYGNISID